MKATTMTRTQAYDLRDAIEVALCERRLSRRDAAAALGLSADQVRAALGQPGRQRPTVLALARHFGLPTPGMEMIR